MCVCELSLYVYVCELSVFGVACVSGSDVFQCGIGSMPSEKRRRERRRTEERKKLE